MGRYHQMTTPGVMILALGVRLDRAGQRAQYVFILSAAYRGPYATINSMIGDGTHVPDS